MFEPAGSVLRSSSAMVAPYTYQAVPWPSVENARVTGAGDDCASAEPTPTASTRTSARTAFIEIVSFRMHVESAGSQRGGDLAQEARQLPGLVPRGQAQRHVAEPGREVGAQLLGALLGAPATVHCSTNSGENFAV